MVSRPSSFWRDLLKLLMDRLCNTRGVVKVTSPSSACPLYILAPIIAMACAEWHHKAQNTKDHYIDVTMTFMASQITNLTVVYSTVYSDVDQRKHQSSASLAFLWGIHRGPVNSPHKGPVTRKMFPFDDVIMQKIYLPLFVRKSNIM